MKLPVFPALAALLAAVFVTPNTVSAQCGDAHTDGGDAFIEGTLRDVIPADQGTGVPIDTPIRLRYFRAVPTPPTVCVTLDAPSQPCLPGEAAVAGDEIIWHPADGVLERRRRYFVSYNESGSGMATTSFTTGTGRAPTTLFFSGITDLRTSPVTDDGCDPSAADITVEFDRATSSPGAFGVSPWPEVDIEYAIYQTRGPGISGARLRDRVRLQRSGSTLVRQAQRTFRLTSAEADGPVCFNIQALDPFGRADGNTYERCVNPARGNYFVGCAATPTSARGGWWTLATLALCLARSTPRRQRPQPGTRTAPRAK